MDGSDFDRSTLLQDFEATAGQKTLEVDVARYDHMLENSGLTPEQRRQTLEALWSIIVTFVELGYGVHPTQQVCGKDEKLSELWDKADSDAVEYEEIKLEEDRDDIPSADEREV
jgi:hypothetical protein